ncbi:hypothetical protein A2U01_0077164, partial [Trifolium medium]|nr:hypothetical protein [Trifolium medium]
MISGLTDAYAEFVTYKQQHDPLPTFAAALSRLELKETTMIQRATRESHASSTSAALMAKQTGVEWFKPSTIANTPPTDPANKPA